MNCWDVLGIEPTRDRSVIEQAYQQQAKFASGDEAERLEQAFRRALGEAGYGAPAPESDPYQPGPTEKNRWDEAAEAGDDYNQPLSDTDRRVVSEVLIQIRALQNDAGRSRDPRIWKAILGEPPADQPPLRREIGVALEPQLRPLAANGELPPDVAHFLGDWFGWHELRDVQSPDELESQPELPGSDAGAAPQMSNFWPAAIGWVVVLVILTTLFSGFGG